MNVFVPTKSDITNFNIFSLHLNKDERTILCSAFYAFLVILLNTMQLKLETKLTQMVKAIALLIVVNSLAEILNLNILMIVINKIVSCGPIAGVVVFQPEIRSGLQYLGSKLHLKKKRNLNSSFLFAMEKAVNFMSKQEIGALITVERNMNLGEFIDTGIKLNADLSGELLINIFTPNTPLHDGAVIIRDGRIAAAGAYLRLTDSRDVSSKYGTRHRAALGVSEVSDSITIVVSEETGEISVAFDGVLLENLSVEKCLEVIRREMSWM